MAEESWWCGLLLQTWTPQTQSEWSIKKQWDHCVHMCESGIVCVGLHKLVWRCLLFESVFVHKISSFLNITMFAIVINFKQLLLPFLSFYPLPYLTQTHFTPNFLVSPCLFRSIWNLKVKNIRLIKNTFQPQIQRNYLNIHFLCLNNTNPVVKIK